MQTSPIYQVNTGIKMFVSPRDPLTPTTSHPKIDIMGRTVLSVDLWTPLLTKYPIVGEGNVSLSLTFDGVEVMSSSGNNVRLVDGLEGRVDFLLVRKPGVIAAPGVGTVSILYNGMELLNDSVVIVQPGERVAPVCHAGVRGLLDTGLHVAEEYVEPSEELEGVYILYLGATNQLIRGMVYKCMYVDDAFAWVPKSAGIDDNLRVAEWE